MPLEFDRAILGQEFDRVEREPVTAADLVAFATSLGETDPCYVDPAHPDLVAHPTFVVRYRGRQYLPDSLPDPLKTRLSLDAGKDIEFGVPIRAGDRISVTSSLHDIYEKTGRSGAMTFVVVRFTIRNQDGALVAYIDNRMLFKN
jgi:acyl dehydratase